MRMTSNSKHEIASRRSYEYSQILANFLTFPVQKQRLSFDLRSPTLQHTRTHGKVWSYWKYHQIGQPSRASFLRASKTATSMWLGALLACTRCAHTGTYIETTVKSELSYFLRAILELCSHIFPEDRQIRHGILAWALSRRFKGKTYHAHAPLYCER
jgi:hypothetical protein